MVTEVSVPHATNGGLRTRNKARRRRAILDAARSLLRGDPHADPTRDQIAALAEVAPATVYNLVGGRTQIWQALADDLLADIRQRLEVGPRPDPLSEVRRIIDVTVNRFVDDRAVALGVLCRWEQSGLLLRGGPVELVRHALRRAQRDGQISDRVRADALGGHIATACLGAMHQWAAGQLDEDQLRARAAFAVEVTIAAVATDDHRTQALRSLRRQANPRRR